jgi:CheY-like chemotaxis protein
MSTGRLIILLVEDDPDISEATRDFLGTLGHAVDTAANGAEALTQLHTCPNYDVILLDLMMPVLDGFAFRQQQLADPRLASIPVVVMTADRRAAAHRARLDAAAVLTKPVGVNELIGALDTIRPRANG